MNKKKTIIIGVIILTVLLAGYLIFKMSSKAMEVKGIQLEETDILRTVDMSGTIYENDSQRIDIPFGVKIEKVYFGENDSVEKGDVLAILDTEDLDLRMRRAQVRLEQINRDIENPSSRISGMDKSVLLNNIEKSKESYKKINNDFQLANDKLEDLKILFDEGAISEWELKNQESLVNDLEIGLKTAQLDINDGELKLSDYSKNISDITGDFTKEREIYLLEIEEIKNDIKNNNIKSEITGIITRMDLKEGRETGQGEFIQIQDPNSFEFRAMVPQEDSVLIQKGQKSTINMSGVSNEYAGIVSSKSKIASVDQESGSSTPKVEVIIGITNENKSLVSGFDADAIVETGIVEDIVALKNEGIKKDESGNYFVYIIDENNKIKKRIVETGLTDGYKTEILSGLELADKIVSNPSVEIKENLEVKIKE